jgi:hypothetical protein
MGDGTIGTGDARIWTTSPPLRCGFWDTDRFKVTLRCSNHHVHRVAKGTHLGTLDRTIGRFVFEYTTAEMGSIHFGGVAGFANLSLKTQPGSSVRR